MLHGDVRGTAYLLSAAKGDKQTLDMLNKEADQARGHDANERKRLLTAIGAAPGAASKALERVLAPGTSRPEAAQLLVQVTIGAAAGTRMYCPVPTPAGPTNG